MPCPGALIALLLASAGAPRWVFTGDILLSREVEREIAGRGGASPWRKMGRFFEGADLVMGNLEGAVGEAADCRGNPCFPIAPDALRFPKAAGFTALSLENNHSADLARSRTREAVLQAGLSAIDFEHSPVFLKSQGHLLSLIAVNTVQAEVPWNALRQKLRLAKALSNWVVVSIHWGAELADWTQPKQREMARWLIAQGADLIVGHHPHVVQAPECIDGKLVLFSLGNHVFDQKYPETKQGLIAECTAGQDQLTCSGVETTTAPGTSFPELRSPERRAIACRVPKRRPLSVGGRPVGPLVLEGTAVARGLLSTEAIRVEGQELLFTLEAHPSSIDGETGPRPYVYAVTPGGLVARWRGSALAWPLIDAELLHASSGDYLCALHRGDSFLMLNPATRETRTAVYRWNGFGFSGVDDPALNDQCRRAFTAERSAGSGSAGEAR